MCLPSAAEQRQQAEFKVSAEIPASCVREETVHRMSQAVE